MSSISGRNTLRVLFTKDLLENILNYRLIIALALCVTIIPLSFYANIRDYQAKELAYRETVRLYEESHKTIRDAFAGAAAFRPPSPLSMLSSGLGPVMPDIVRTVGHLSQLGAQTELKTSQSLDSPYQFLFGRIDLSLIVSIIISLLAIMLGYNSVAGEKEQKTLQLIMSNSVPKDLIIFSKIIANVVLLIIVFLIGVLLGIFMILALGSPVLGSGYLILRLILGIGISIIYIMAFANLCVLVSSLNKRSSSAIVSLMFLWVFLFMFIPKVSIIISKVLIRVESQQSIDLDKERIRMQIENEKHSELQKLKDSTIGVKDMTTGEFFLKLRQGDKDAKGYVARQNQIAETYNIRCQNELNKLDSYNEMQVARQLGLARYLSRLSPISCYYNLMMEISNTGLIEYGEWKLLRGHLKQVLDTEITRKLDSVVFSDESISTTRKIDEDLPMPMLSYQEIPLRKTFSIIWPDLILLVIYGFIYFAGAYVAFLKYDVR